MLLMLVVPIFLTAAAFGVARRVGAGPGGADPFRKRLVAELNRRVNDNPGSLADPATLAMLDRQFEPGQAGGWVVLKDGVELYRSAGLRAVNPSMGGMPGRGRAFVSAAPMLRWDFRYPDGSRGTLELYGGFPWSNPWQGPGWALVFLGVLAACNGLLGWWVSSAVVTPLARLRDAAVRIGDGDLGFTLARDVPGEFGQVTAAFETMREKLQAAVGRQVAEEASRKELIAHVSHDLRTPINLVRGYAEGLRDGVASTPEMRSRYLDTILERAGELERLIELLFSYSTMDLEGVKPAMGDVDLAPLLEELRSSISGMFPSATISLSSGTARPVVRADPHLLRRVMTNLVENAVKHGGKEDVAITWTVTAGVSAGVSADPRARAVEVSVGDDGAGVSPADLPRIFEPFFRGDRARSRGGGAGLGLAIVRKLVEAQGGSVRAARAASGGLEVTLRFLEGTDSGKADPDHRG